MKHLFCCNSISKSRLTLSTLPCRIIFYTVCGSFLRHFWCGNGITPTRHINHWNGKADYYCFILAAFEMIYSCQQRGKIPLDKTPTREDGSGFECQEKWLAESAGIGWGRSTLFLLELALPLQQAVMRVLGPTCALSSPRTVAGRFHRHILPLHASMVTARF
jgi:hypothetical protein